MSDNTLSEFTGLAFDAMVAVEESEDEEFDRAVRTAMAYAAIAQAEAADRQAAALEKIAETLDSPNRWG